MPHLKTIYTLFFLLLTNVFFGQTNTIIDSIYINELLDNAAKITVDNPTKGDSVYTNIVQLTRKKKYQKGTYLALKEKAFIQYEKSAYKKAIYFFKEALKLESYIKDKNNIGQCYFKMGTSHLFLGEHIEATEAYHKTIDLFKATNDTLNLIKVYDNFGVIFGNMNNYKKAEEYKIKTIVLAKQIKDTFLMASGSLNLGTIYTQTKRFDKAYEQYMFVNRLAPFLNNDRIYHHLYKNLAKYYSDKENMDECLVYALKAEPYLRYSNNKLEKSYYQYFLGAIYQELNNNEKAEKHLLKSYELAKDIESESLQLNSLLPLSGLYAEKKEYKKAYEYSLEYYKLNEKTRSDKNNTIVTELDIKYQTEKKDKEILTQKIELQQQKTTKNYMIGLVVFLLLASMLSWLYFKQRQKRKNQEIVTLKREHQIKTLESLMEGEEKERFRIAKELHDGVNGDLSAIKFKLSSLLEMNNNVIKEAIAMIDSSCQQVRAISHNLVPPSLENFNLLEATEEYCAEMNAIQKIEISFQHLGDSVSIPKKAEVNVFRIIQELMTNSNKHSGANEITVQISCRDKNLQVTVEDDGKGYDKNNQKGDGIGLKNIASRIEYLQATIDVVSNNQGTSTTIEIDTTKLNEH